MAKQWSIADRIGTFGSWLMTLLVFVMMALAEKLGLSRQTLRIITSQLQSPQIKQQAFKGYRPTRHDVLVCTYAKSGTYWTIQIAHQIAHRGRGEFRHIHDVVPFPEAPMSNTIIKLSDEAPYRAAQTGLRVIKTHLESSYVPYSPEAKYIVVLRDPKDVFVSSYFFTQGMISGSMLPVEEWLRLFLAGKFMYGSWVEHLVGYWPWRNRANVLFLTFEEMKDDLEEAVRRIAALMDVELTDEEFAQVVEKSQFQNMKRINQKFTPERPWPFNKGVKGFAVMRRGARGGSSELLSPEQQYQIDQHMKAELQRHGCDFPYEQMFETVSQDASAAAA
ncbi:MAG TPA: sulfotransferase domain-containing protein [Herpetosiphonaceae bacterium]